MLKVTDHPPITLTLDHLMSKWWMMVMFASCLGNQVTTETFLLPHM